VAQTGERTSESELERELSEPWGKPAEAAASLEGDVLVLGAGGKMGPTLAMLLRRCVRGRVHAASRWSDGAARDRLEASGVATIEIDLLDREAYRGLPAAQTVYFLAGMKFGASARRDLTWAMNAHVPALVAEHFRGSRIVVFSTGNVYPFVPVDGAGATEDTDPEPVGEYAQSCLARERMFQYFSARHGTPVTVVRLNYANEPRYGVILDVAAKVLHGQPVDLEMGHVNVIWQGDANAYIAASARIAASPPAILNVAGRGVVRIRDLAAQIGLLVGREPVLSGSEQPKALLSDASRCFELYGPPRASLAWMTERIALWLTRGGRTLGKPTKFQVRDGRF
jgi:nucleoside-diphosphate-sugar epimerase